MSKYLEFVQSRCDWISCLQPKDDHYTQTVNTALIQFHQQAIAIKSITPELASQAISTVKRLIGEAAGTKLTQFLQPLVNVGPNFEPHGMQICHYFQFYIPEKLWDLYYSSSHIDTKIHNTAIHMNKLGLKHPAERTTSLAAGIIHYCTSGYETDATTSLQTQRKLKEFLKMACSQHPLRNELGPPCYPVSPDGLKDTHPHLYQDAFGEGGPVACPIPASKLLMIRDKTPRRITKEMVDRGVQRLPYEGDQPHIIAPSKGDRGKSKGKLNWYFDKSEGKYVAKSKAKHDAKKSPTLPEFPGFGNMRPIEYGNTTVYFSLAQKEWLIVANTATYRRTVVPWGRSRIEKIKNWEKVRRWLRKYNRDGYRQVSVLLPATFPPHG